MTMKVFGIGLNKTGTSSLGHALRLLGFTNHVDGRPDLLNLWATGTIEPILKEAENYNNFEDWPWPLVYKELFARFPNAKFILTKRKSAEVWFTSLCNHADRTGPTLQRHLVYGHANPYNFKDEHIQFYRTHNAAVEAFFAEHAPEKLLTICFEEDNNWQKLASFLGTDHPNLPFPHVKPLQQPKPTLLNKLGKSIRRKGRS